MKMVKPLRLSALYRPYRWQEMDHLGVSILALADMGDASYLRPEPELWQLASEELALSGGVIDLAFPKACAEFLATGYAYTHHQANKTACAVKIRVDTLEKTLATFGDRHWINGRPSTPLPFDQMRLDWSRAFGSPQWAENPHGIGAHPERLPGGFRHMLPNIEAFNERLTSPRQTPLPASFDAIDINWPRRFSRIGKKYDENWLQNEFPGLASDADWRLFNMADSDQQWPHRDALPAGATYEIWNMHPQIPCLRGRLPRWIARCFINRLRDGVEVLEEIAMRHTTVWFFPHRQKMILIYHGSARINEDDAADVLHLMPALEEEGARRTTNHYRKVLHQRCDKEKGGLYAFREKDLVSQAIIGSWFDTEQTKEQSAMARNANNYQRHVQQQLREQLLSEGQDFDEVIPQVEHPQLDELPEFVERLEQDAEEQKQAAFDQMRGLGVDPEASVDPEKQGSGYDNFKNMRDLLRQHSVSEDRESQEEQERGLYQVYLLSAHTQVSPPRLSRDQAKRMRDRVIEIQQKDKNYSGMDLTGADLSGLDLSRSDFSRCMLENADLSGCCLDHANFHEAMLARADLTETKLRHANLDQASLALARCENTDFSYATLVETNIQEAYFWNCGFSECKLEQLLLPKTFITQCDFSNATLDAVTMLELKLNNLRFSSSELRKVAFVRCALEAFDFSHAQLDCCSFVETLAERCIFHGATMQACSFAAQSSLPQADFNDATLKQCNFRQLPLHQASFRRARLENCDFSEAQLNAANLQQMNGNGSLFVRCDFSDADLSNASLITALMQKSRFCRTNLHGTNLFRADLSRSRIDGTTKVAAAYTNQTKTLPRAPRKTV